MNKGEGKCRPFFADWCRRYAAHFTAVGAAFELRLGEMLTVLLTSWCRRYDVHFTAVGADFYITARVSAARF